MGYRVLRRPWEKDGPSDSVVTASTSTPALPGGMWSVQVLQVWTQYYLHILYEYVLYRQQLFNHSFFLQTKHRHANAYTIPIFAWRLGTTPLPLRFSLALSLPISSISTLNNIVTLKSGLQVTQCHWNWMSLKLMPFESLGAVSYSPSIVTMDVSVAVCEIFCVKEWCDFENRVRVRSTSLEMAPFDRSHTSSYSSSIV